MKSLLLFLFIITGFAASATTYYFAASGNDANNGTSASTPWQTVTKFNTVFASKSAGDNFVFNRGDVFYGNLVISRSGASGSPITIGAYGTGANPVITGFTTVNAWTNLGSNIWESTAAVSSLPATSMVTINGVNTAMGRFPNTGWSTYQSFSGKTSITSSSLNSAITNWTGAEVVIRKQHWIIDRSPVTAQSGGTLTYTSGSTYNGQSNWGFFIQNDSRTLDVQNEWYYNPSTKKIRIYSTSSPTNVNVSTKDTLVYIRSKSYITFDGISFTGSNKDAFQISADHITIQNCNIDFSGKDAIWGASNAATSTNFVFQNNTINHTNNNAINLESLFSGALISGNVIKNTGMITGMGENGSTNYGAYEAIQTRATNVIVQNNEVDSTGYVGIGFYNNGTVVKNNFVNTFCMTIDDGAGIYTWVGTGNTPFTGMKVLNNIVVSGIGTNAGTPDTGNPVSHGIYMDDVTSGVEVAGNTSANNSYSGLYLHNANNLNIHDNTFFNNGTQQVLLASYDAVNPIRNAAIKNNLIISKVSTQKVSSFQTRVADISSFGNMDSNYWARPIDDNLTMENVINNYTTYTSRTLAQWQTYSAQDADSKKSPKAITTVNDIRLEYNTTSVNKIVSLDGNYIDVKNVPYNGTITLLPFTSAVLIRNGAVTNQSPVANAGADQSITLPVNNANLTGSGTDPDGTISAYSWTKISGPAAGTITNATSATTSLTGSVQGIYQLQLKVTDNNSATALDTVKITVNAAANMPPTTNAGADQSITLPTNTVSLSGSGTDVDGTVTAYAWTKISGPSAGTITNANTASTSLTGLVQGVYQYSLKVTDNNSATALDTVKITVNAAANMPPTANAGTDQSIKLPTNTVSFTGSGTDADGTVTGYAWTKISGPASGTITNAASASTSVTGLVQGTYQYQLQVTDNNGATALDIIQISVNAATNIPPTANAGADQSITLPVNSANLGGSGADADGTVTSYAWRIISGPLTGTITNANSASTPVTGLAQGIYLFQLTVTDNNAAIALDTIKVTVNAGSNISPTANAGADQSITLPTRTVSLSGSGTDPDGTVASYVWTKISGPSSYTISHSTSAATTVTGLAKGVYQFQLKVTDNKGASGLDNIQITVNAAGSLLPAVNPSNTVNGLDYKYYEASGYSVVPDFSTLTPVKTGTVTNFDISVANRATAFSFNFTGFINVPSDGQYTFYTTSDDGSNLYIDNVLVVNNDGPHGATEASGTIGLRAGKHAISVGYFQQGGGSILTVSYSATGVSKQAVPASALYRVSAQGRSELSSANTSGNNQTIVSATQVSVKAYPNPFVNYIKINITGGVAGEYKLMLIDASGRTVWNASGIKDAGAFEQSVNTSTLVAGIYFLKVIQNNTSSVTTLVK